MQITNKKLIKNFSDILSASIKAKDIINSEMEKVDAKYAELAKKEKADLAKQASLLEAQIATYSAFLNSNGPEETDEPEFDGAGFTAEDNKVKEEKVVDTLFPENNIADTPSEIDDDIVEPVMKDDENENSSEDEEWEETPEYEDIKDDVAALDDSFAENVEEEVAITDSNDEWPELPEEWKN